MTIGIYANMSEADYHALPYLSNSKLKKLEVDALEYWYYSEMNPAPPEREESSAMALGSALHAAILQPERFAREWVVKPTPDDYAAVTVIRMVEDAKAYLAELGLSKSGNKPELLARVRDADPAVCIWEDVLADYSAGLDMGRFQEITADNFAMVSAMAERLRQNQDAAALLAGALPEVVILWEENGVQCKAMMDALSPVIIGDVKSFSVKGNRNISATVAQAVRYENYNVQWVWYRRGLERVKDAIKAGTAEIEGIPDEFINSMLESHQRFVLFFVRTAAPYQIRIKELVHSQYEGAEPNTYYINAEYIIDRNLKEIAALTEKFGESPWLEGEGLEILQDEEIPGIMYQGEKR